MNPNRGDHEQDRPKDTDTETADSTITPPGEKLSEFAQRVDAGIDTDDPTATQATIAALAGEKAPDPTAETSSQYPDWATMHEMDRYQILSSQVEAMHLEVPRPNIMPFVNDPSFEAALARIRSEIASRQKKAEEETVFTAPRDSEWALMGIPEKQRNIVAYFRSKGMEAPDTDSLIGMWGRSFDEVRENVEASIRRKQEFRIPSDDEWKTMTSDRRREAMMRYMMENLKITGFDGFKIDTSGRAATFDEAIAAYTTPAVRTAPRPPEESKKNARALADERFARRAAEIGEGAAALEAATDYDRQLIESFDGRFLSLMGVRGVTAETLAADLRRERAALPPVDNERERYNALYGAGENVSRLRYFMLTATEKKLVDNQTDPSIDRDELAREILMRRGVIARM